MTDGGRREREGPRHAGRQRDRDPSDGGKDRAQAVWGATPAGSAHAPELQPGTEAFFTTARAARRHELPFLRELVPFDRWRGRRVVEVGCGLGFDAADLAGAGTDYIGLDITPANPARTRAHLAPLGLRPLLLVADAESLPLPDASVDAVFSNGVLHHTPDLAAALPEAGRVLRPGGELWVAVYHRHSVYRWVTLYLVQYLLRGRFRRQTFRELLEGIEWTTSGERPIVRTYSRRQLRNALGEAGFRVSAIDVRRLQPWTSPTRRSSGRWFGASPDGCGGGGSAVGVVRRGSGCAARRRRPVSPARPDDSPHEGNAMEDRSELLARYHETHGSYVDGPPAAKSEWFRRRLDEVYAAHLPPVDSQPAVLELACGSGYLLEALRDRGYRRLTGIDLSASDVRAARTRVPEAEVVEEDATRFLEAAPEPFDVVMAKALLEHVPKEKVIPLLRAVRDALGPGGVALIEVPNMDWMLAGHERYMDFTHEVGFTRESLGQVLRTLYDDVTVLPVPPTELRGAAYRVARRLLWPLARWTVRSFLKLAGGDGEHTLWEYRSILGVARRSTE